MSIFQTFNDYKIINHSTKKNIKEFVLDNGNSILIDQTGKLNNFWVTSYGAILQMILAYNEVVQIIWRTKAPNLVPTDWFHTDFYAGVF